MARGLLELDTSETSPRGACSMPAPLDRVPSDRGAHQETPRDPLPTLRVPPPSAPADNARLIPPASRYIFPANFY